MAQRTPDELAARFARNVRHLRTARGPTQAQVAKLAEVPRATWAHLESGAANPTLAVLHRAAAALQVSLEELVGGQRAAGRLVKRAALATRVQGDAVARKFLPDRVPGVELERLELPPGGRWAGVPHTPGTREYFTCEQGGFALWVAGEKFALERGDVLVFRGDQRHSYTNPGRSTAVGYSVVLLAPVE